MVAYVKDGDVGCGAPGTTAWHRVQVAQRTDAEIIEYLKEAFNMSVPEIAEFLIDGHSNRTTEGR